MLTVTRSPRMHGSPPGLAGSTLTRSSSMAVDGVTSGRQSRPPERGAIGSVTLAPSPIVGPAGVQGLVAVVSQL